MKIALYLSLLFCSLMFCLNIYAKPTSEPLDLIIATVNDDVITQSELNHAIVLVRMQIAQDHLSAPEATVLKKQVLDQLINKKLQLQLAKLLGITVTEAELDKVIAHIAKQNQLSVNQLYQRLSHDGMTTNDYRNEMRDQLIIQRLQQQEVVNRITITPEEVTTFTHSKTWRENISKEYHLEDILIPLSDNPSPEEIDAAKKYAEIIITKINQGQNFQEVAAETTNQSFAIQAGDLGWRKLPEIPASFTEQVAHMRPHQLASPIQAANGLHIVRLIDIRTVDPAKAAPSHQQIEELLFQRKVAEAVQNWVSKLRSQAFIATNLGK